MISNIDLIFKIASVGIFLSVLQTVLAKAGKEDYATLANLLGVVIILGIVLKEIGTLFDTVKTMFNLY